MGKKNKKQRREQKARSEAASPVTVRTGLPGVSFRTIYGGGRADGKPMRLVDYAEDVPGTEAWLMSLLGDDPTPKPERKSTLPAAYTDLLKVEAPSARRYTMIPPHARSRPVEDFLEFHKSAPAPKRIGGGLVMEEPPLAMVCPECSVRRPFSSGRGFSLFGEASGFDACKYCGVHLTVHGTRLMWWR